MLPQLERDLPDVAVFTSAGQARTGGQLRGLDEFDARSVRVYRAYYFGEEPGFDGDWVSELFPDGLPAWATLVLVRAIAGNLLCRMECIRCAATGSPVFPQGHRDGCDYASFDRS